MKSLTFIPSNAPFKTVASGNSSNTDTWKVKDVYGNWVDSKGYLPDKGNDVYIEDTHTLTVDQDFNCRNLWICNKQNVQRLNLNNRRINVWGTMNLYGGTADVPGGPDGASPPTTPIQLIGAGYIRFKGTTDREIIPNAQSNASRILYGWTLEVDFSNIAKATINNRFRCGYVDVVNGVLEVPAISNPFRTDLNGLSGDSAPGGWMTIRNGARLIARQIEKSTTAPIGSFSLEAGGSYENNGNSNYIAATSATLSGTYIAAFDGDGDLAWPSTGRTGSVTIINYNNLQIGGSGTKTLRNRINVTGKLTILSVVTINLNGFVLEYGVNGDLEYAATVSTGNGIVASGSSAVTVNGNYAIPRNLIVKTGVILTLTKNINIRGSIILEGTGTINYNGFTINQNYTG